MLPRVRREQVSHPFLQSIDALRIVGPKLIKKASPSHRIRSFNVEIKIETIRRKKLSASIEARNLAIGKGDGHVEFWHNKEHSADHRVVTKKFRALRSDTIETSTVAMTSVDAFITSHNLRNVSFIKIDVQGYELGVCEGMQQTLERFPGLRVCFEYSPEGLVELGFEPEKVLEFFRIRNYRI